jgi:hypothetical protein
MESRSRNIVKIAAGLAGGAALGSAGAANAAIINGQIQTGGSEQIIDSPLPPTEVYQLDLNNDATIDVSLKSKYSKSKPGKDDGDTTVYYTYSGDLISPTNDNALSAAPVSAGEEIGPGTVFSAPGTAVTVTYDNGNPSPYFAFRFGAAAPYNYGWIQLREGPLTTAWDLFAFGYESAPDTPIIVGAVPEPAALSMLAVGAAAVALRRRSKCA